MEEQKTQFSLAPSKLSFHVLVTRRNYKQCNFSVHIGVIWTKATRKNASIDNIYTCF